MKIKDIRLTPLHCPFKQPYHWSQGVTYGAPVVLIEMETDGGVTGIGECSASPTHAPILAILEDALPRFIGQSVYDVNRLIWS